MCSGLCLREKRRVSMGCDQLIADSQALQRPMTEVVDSVGVHRLKPVPPSCPSQLMWASDPSDGPAVYAKACATTLLNPTARNVETPVTG
jgi:hypothetical protein